VVETWPARLARSASETEAESFRLLPGSAVEIFQTYYDRSGTPLFCLTVTVYQAERNLFQVTAGSVPLLDELWTTRDLIGVPELGVDESRLTSASPYAG
jgi:hypothetical protein